MTASAAITRRDVELMLGLVKGADDPGEPLPWSLIAGLAELIGCDAVSFFDVDSERQATSFGQSFPADDDGASDWAFWLHYWDCLACSYPDRSGDLRSITMASDFYTEREWHQLGMYSEYLRPVGVEHELMVCLPGGPGRTMRLVFFRGPGADFSERDRGILTLLRPHLHHAYLEAELRHRGVPDLTPRQWELIRLVATGCTNAQIARRLFVSEGTVRKHLENIFERLDVTSRLAAVDRAFPDRLTRLGADPPGLRGHPVLSNVLAPLTTDVASAGKQAAS